MICNLLTLLKKLVGVQIILSFFLYLFYSDGLVECNKCQRISLGSLLSENCQHKKKIFVRKAKERQIVRIK